MINATSDGGGGGAECDAGESPGFVESDVEKHATITVMLSPGVDVGR